MIIAVRRTIFQRKHRRRRLMRRDAESIGNSELPPRRFVSHYDSNNQLLRGPIFPGSSKKRHQGEKALASLLPLQVGFVSLLQPPLLRCVREETVIAGAAGMAYFFYAATAFCKAGSKTPRFCTFLRRGRRRDRRRVFTNGCARFCHLGAAAARQCAHPLRPSPTPTATTASVP